MRHIRLPRPQKVTQNLPKTYFLSRLAGRAIPLRESGGPQAKSRLAVDMHNTLNMQAMDLDRALRLRCARLQQESVVRFQFAIQRWFQIGNPVAETSYPVMGVS